MARQSLLADVIDGVVAGFVATWAMNFVTTKLYEREGKEACDRENAARGGKTAYETAAEKAAHVAGVKLTPDERKQYATAIHWGLGVTSAIAFAILRSRSEAASRAGGLLFGTALWLAVDETLTPALGLTPGPRAFPWQTHARGLAGHLAYGATVATVATLAS